jgi:hypothetical protein
MTTAFTEVKVPRRNAYQVMIPNQISTIFSQDEPIGVKWKVTFGLAASHALTSRVS